MTKKSKSKSKVTSSGAVNDSVAKNTSETQVNGNSETFSASSHKHASPVENGKSTSSSAFITNNLSKFHKNGSSDATKPSLGSIPGIVDDFLAPKFVKVLSLSDHGYEKTPPPPLPNFQPTRVTNITAAPNSKVKKENEDELELEASSCQKTPPSKKNKRKKSKPIKPANNEFELGRELDDLTVNDSDDVSKLRETGLSTKDVSNLAKHQRIRSSAFRYEGNNIVLVPNENDDNARSCYDDYNFVYDEDEQSTLTQDQTVALGSASARSQDSSNIYVDPDDDDDDENGRQGSWSVPGASYQDCWSPSTVASSNPVDFSETEQDSNSLNKPKGTSRFYPGLVKLNSIWDGVNNPCEIKDCSNLANKKCIQCKNVFYCGEEHQRIDWKKHKNECIPYRMESRFGDDVSVAVASRNIPAGQKIFSDKPLLVLPVADPSNDFINVMDVPCIRKRLSCSTDPLVDNGDDNEAGKFCSAVKPACFGCMRVPDEMTLQSRNTKCNRCQLPLCSYKCHMDSTHQASECQAITSLGGWDQEKYFCHHTMYLDIEIVRALQMEAVNSTQWESFMEMKQNVRVESYKCSNRYLRFIENYRELVPISAKLSGYNDDLIGNVHAIITALSFRPFLTSSYKLLFSTLILFGHDCVPNTFHYLEDSATGKVSGMTLVVKAATAICKKEIITIDFTPTPFLYYPLRRMILRNMLSIDNCVCKRCACPTLIEDHSGDIKCPRCHHGVICPEKAIKWNNSVWACNLCLEEYSYSFVFSITKECREELAALLRQPRHLIVPGLQKFINQRENDLHPGHSIILQAWGFIETHLKHSLTATRLAGPGPRYPAKTVEEYRLLARCSTAIDDHLKIIRPGICFERGCLLFNKYQMELVVAAQRYHIRETSKKEYIQELMQCIRTLQEALKIFQMFEGYNRDVALYIQEATSSLVTTKSYIQELMITDTEETKQKRATNLLTAASLYS